MDIFLIALGGMLGALTRHFSYVGIKYFGADLTPIATILINLIGCLLIGIFMGLGEKILPLQRTILHLGVIGFLGSFTTFSTFSYESWNFWEQQRYVALLAYISIQVIIGTALAGLGRHLILKI